MWPSGTLAGSQQAGSSILTITYAANDTNVDLFDDIVALYGAQPNPVTVIATINAGVVINGGSSSPAFDTGGFAGGSSITLVNYGSIWGKGGAGGDGGNKAGVSAYSAGDDGHGGGDAISLQDNITIDNTTTGQIFGGGGGGGGGGAGQKENFVGGSPGSGGGGGQGSSGGAKGLKGTGTGSANDGTNGSSSGYGSGGDAGGAGGGKGGRGGGWGSNGNGGSDGGPFISRSGGSSGNAGKAIEKNGRTVTWIAGNNTTQVKGAVS